MTVGFATEMPGGEIMAAGQIPFDDHELLISALDPQTNGSDSD
jgi:hypothetical protein